MMTRQQLDPKKSDKYRSRRFLFFIISASNIEGEGTRRVGAPILSFSPRPSKGAVRLGSAFLHRPSSRAHIVLVCNFHFCPDHRRTHIVSVLFLHRPHRSAQRLRFSSFLPRPPEKGTHSVLVRLAFFIIFALTTEVKVAK